MILFNNSFSFKLRKNTFCNFLCDSNYFCTENNQNYNTWKSSYLHKKLNRSNRNTSQSTVTMSVVFVSTCDMFCQVSLALSSVEHKNQLASFKIHIQHLYMLVRINKLIKIVFEVFISATHRCRKTLKTENVFEVSFSKQHFKLTRFIK